jgi:hypothetical protein
VGLACNTFWKRKESNPILPLVQIILDFRNKIRLHGSGSVAKAEALRHQNPRHAEPFEITPRFPLKTTLREIRCVINSRP